MQAPPLKGSTASWNCTVHGNKCSDTGPAGRFRIPASHWLLGLLISVVTLWISTSRHLEKEGESLFLIHLWFSVLLSWNQQAPHPFRGLDFCHQIFFETSWWEQWGGDYWKEQWMAVLVCSSKGKQWEVQFLKESSTDVIFWKSHVEVALNSWRARVCRFKTWWENYPK